MMVSAFKTLSQLVRGATAATLLGAGPATDAAIAACTKAAASLPMRKEQLLALESQPCVAPLNDVVQRVQAQSLAPPVVVGAINALIKGSGGASASCVGFFGLRHVALAVCAAVAQ